MNETQVVRDFYAAINGNDVPAAVRGWDVECSWEDPDGGIYEGLATLTAHFERARGRWAEGSCELEEVTVVGERVVAFVAVRVRLHGETDWRVGQLGDVFAYRDGRVVRARSFVERREALEWAGAWAVSPEAAR